MYRTSLRDPPPGRRPWGVLEGLEMESSLREGRWGSTLQRHAGTVGQPGDRRHLLNGLHLPQSKVGSIYGSPVGGAGSARAVEPLLEAEKKPALAP